MQRKWALGALAAVIVVAGMSALALRSRRKPPPPPSAAAVITNDGITLNGTIRPQHVAGVAASVSGNIDRFFVEVGEDVFQGQLLARIGSSGLDSAKEAGTQAVERAQDHISKMEAAANSARMETSRSEAEQRARSQMDRAQTYERQTTLNRAGATPKSS
jgi:multidrug efflux pump subunit AcrA (membrane-fusion protein)